MNTRPEPNEYYEYYGRYISLVEGSDVLAALSGQFESTVALLRGIGEERGNFAYEPGKWTVKQVVGHVLDAERIFAYRALRFARNDSKPIEGFEQDDYVLNGPFEHCRLMDLADEFEHVRKSTVHLFKSLDEAAWLRRGLANTKEISVRALAYVIAGHELHHARILREKYRV